MCSRNIVAKIKISVMKRRSHQTFNSCKLIDSMQKLRKQRWLHKYDILVLYNIIPVVIKLQASMFTCPASIIKRDLAGPGSNFLPTSWSFLSGTPFSSFALTAIESFHKLMKIVECEAN